ncbi:MAG: DUF1707 SHOCT-like domain-containing protein, partial [Nocardioides sp.]
MEGRMDGSAMRPHETQRRETQLHDPSLLRISDADRNRVSEVLRRAAGDGRIDLAELDERLDAVFAAKTYADLVPITVDLPEHHDAAPQETAASQLAPRRERTPAATAGYHSSRAVMAERKRQGAWLVPAEHAAFAFMGGVTLDLRQACFAQDTVTITATAIMGEVRVIVDAHTHVEVDGTPIMGDFSQGKDKVRAQLS